jgi:hypothetical protein
MIAHQTIESFNNDPEAAGKNLETSQLYWKLKDGSSVDKMFKIMKEEPLHGYLEC